jgi:ATP phosphoribosyltransferase
LTGGVVSFIFEVLIKAPGLRGLFLYIDEEDFIMDLEQNSSRPVRLSLPSKGRLAEESLAFLEASGLKVYKPNPRQYEARMPGLPELVVIFQRPGDIVVSVRDGSVDFGISGMDIIEERKGEGEDILILHDNLGFGRCALTLAVPETWHDVACVGDLLMKMSQMDCNELRIATKYPFLTRKFLENLKIPHKLIYAEGTLETAPSIGYADMISDLVSSGQTLRDNRLKPLQDGVVLSSQAALIANKKILATNPAALQVARQLLEYLEAHLRASENLAVFANMRGPSAEVIANRIFTQTTISGLQGPTLSKVVVREHDESWFAVNIIVHRSEMFKAVNELRAIGGSGVVVMPVTYIFEEEPPRYKAMLEALKKG